MNPAGARLLAVDTSGPGAGLALCGEGRTDVAGLADAGRARTERLADEAAGLLGRRGWTAADLTVLGAVVGPGSYTGLRSGLAFVRGLALARELPVVPVGSLELAAWASSSPGEEVLALWPLGNGRWAAARFAREEDGASLLLGPEGFDEEGLAGLLAGPFPAPAALSLPAGTEPPPAGLPLPAGCELRVVGDGALRALAELALLKAGRGLAQGADLALPVYVGPGSARPNRARVAVAPVTE